MTQDQYSGGLTFWEKITRRKLKNYLFLDKKLQLNFALLLAVVGAFNAIYFSALVYFHSRESFIRLAAFVPEYLLSDEFFKENYKLFLTTIAFATLGEAIFIGLLGLFFSHRIAGPLYAMSAKLGVIAKGEIPEEVHLRKNDFLTQFADKLNETIGALKSRRSEMLAALDDLKAGRSAECEARLKKLTETAPELAPSSTDAAPPQG